MPAAEAAAGSTGASRDSSTSVCRRIRRSLPRSLARGKELYNVDCAHCHGEKGDGAGYGAPFLVPPPRDFVAAQFKFRTTASGQLPTDKDMFRIISRGANGHRHAAVAYLLDDSDRWALVDT